RLLEHQPVMSTRADSPVRASSKARRTPSAVAYRAGSECRPSPKRGGAPILLCLLDPLVGQDLSDGLHRERGSQEPGIDGEQGRERLQLARRCSVVERPPDVDLEPRVDAA